MTLPPNIVLLEDLREQHLAAIRNDESWKRVWGLIVTHPWYRARVDMTARLLIRRFSMSSIPLDDIKQEALIHFARSIENKKCLGYDPARGSYGGLLATIILRCCQKSLLPFRHNRESTLFEREHPFVDAWEQIDQRIDFAESVSKIKDPFRRTIVLVSEGYSIDSIAQHLSCTPRTVYRWLDKGIAQMQAICNPSDRK